MDVMLTQHELDRLLTTLCVRNGFCLPPDAENKLRDVIPSGPVAFTDAVFTLEGLDHSTADRRLYRAIRAVVEAAFRAATIASENE